MSRTRKLLAALSIAGMTAGASVVMSGSATAAETCHYTRYANYTGGPTIGASVSCTGVSRQYRVVIVCHDGINEVNYTRYGVYVSSPRSSRADCAAPQRQTVTKFGRQLK